jgi:hypothetical protein
MSDWPWEADKTNLLNRKDYLEHDISYDWSDQIILSGYPTLETVDVWKCDLDKVKSHLSLLDRGFELYNMTAQLDQLGTELPLALCICNEVIKNELQQTTAKLSELGSALGPDPGPGPLATAQENPILDFICGMLAVIGSLTLMISMTHGIPYIANHLFESISDFISMMYVYNMTVPSDPVDNVEMNGEVLADLSDVSVWTFISELNHCAMIVAYNTIMSIFE